MGFLAAILDSGPIFRRRKNLFRLAWSKVPESIEKTLTGKRCDYVLARTGLYCLVCPGTVIFFIKREMSKNAILLIIAPPRDQMTPDFFPALGKEPRSMPSNFISINQSVLDINQDGGTSILTQNDVIGCVELGLAQGFQ